MSSINCEQYLFCLEIRGKQCNEESKTSVATSVTVCIVLEARLYGEEDVPEEKKSCRVKNPGEGIGNWAP